MCLQAFSEIKDCLAALILNYNKQVTLMSCTYAKRHESLN